MKRFLIQYRRTFMAAALVLLALPLSLALCGCGVPAWLSDAGNIIALVGSSFTSIAAFIAGLTGNAALAAALTVVSTWIAKVQSGIQDLQTLISQYQKSPSTGLLAEIEEALDDVQANIVQDFSNLGLPASVLTIISGIAGEAASLLADWSAAIAGVKSATSTAAFHAALAKMTKLADNLPNAMSSYKTAVNKYLSTKTGDPMIDAALAKTPKL